MAKKTTKRRGPKKTKGKGIFKKALKASAAVLPGLALGYLAYKNPKTTQRYYNKASDFIEDNITNRTSNPLEKGYRWGSRKLRDL